MVIITLFVWLSLGCPHKIKDAFRNLIWWSSSVPTNWPKVGHDDMLIFPLSSLECFTLMGNAHAPKFL